MADTFSAVFSILAVTAPLATVKWTGDAVLHRSAVSVALQSVAVDANARSAAADASIAGGQVAKGSSGAASWARAAVAPEVEVVAGVVVVGCSIGSRAFVDASAGDAIVAECTTRGDNVEAVAFCTILAVVVGRASGAFRVLNDPTSKAGAFSCSPICVDDAVTVSTVATVGALELAHFANVFRDDSAINFSDIARTDTIAVDAIAATARVVAREVLSLIHI